MVAFSFVVRGGERYEPARVAHMKPRTATRCKRKIFFWPHVPRIKAMSLAAGDDQDITLICGRVARIRRDALHVPVMEAFMCPTRANRGTRNTKDDAMTTNDLQDLLQRIFENLLDARDAVEGDDDDIELADIARDMVSDTDDIAGVVTYDDVMMLTNDEGLVIRTGSGDEFQITIHQSRFGSQDD
jgi:hypothetical protein